MESSRLPSIGVPNGRMDSPGLLSIDVPNDLSPLLGDRAVEDVGLEDNPTFGEVVRESRHQLELGLPVALMNVMDYAISLISVAFVGRLGALPLAGAAMATSFANVFGFAILEGLAGGLETAGGQAHGAGQPELLGLLLQRGVLVLLLFCVPLSLLCLNAPSILHFMGQDPAIIYYSGQYVLCVLPGLFATACYLPVAKFLQVQGITVPLAAISLTVLVCHVPVNWLLIHGLGLGFIGAGLAQSSSSFLALVLMWLYLLLEPTGILKRAWPGWSLAVFQNWLQFLSLALPAAAMTCFEWWVYEILLIMSGWLPQPDISVAAMNICFQTTGICFMLPLGLGTAVSVRVSNELGARRPGKARWALIVSVIIGLVTGGGLSVVLMLMRNNWALLFTSPSETRVIQLVALVMPTLVLSQLGVALSTVLSGFLRGSGQQWAGSLVNGLSLYIGALPAAYLLGFTWKLGLQGLWWGMMGGVWVQILANIFLAWTTDWNLQVARAMSRLESSCDTMLKLDRSSANSPTKHSD